MRENEIQSDCSITWLENGIIVQDVNNDITIISMPIANRLIADRKYASGGISPLPVMVWVNNAVNVDLETKKYYKQPEPYDGISAIAMIVDNWVAKIIGNLIFQFQKHYVPTEIFSNKEKALKWLEQFKS